MTSLVQLKMKTKSNKQAVFRGNIYIKKSQTLQFRINEEHQQKTEGAEGEKTRHSVGFGLTLQEILSVLLETLVWICLSGGHWILFKFFF